MQQNIVEAYDLKKKYGKFTALEDVSFTVKRGDIYGLIGRNGAGKTTIMKIITGLAEKSDGDFKLFSDDSGALYKAKKRIGCLIENPAFFPNLNAYQNLKYYAIQKGIIDKNQVDEVLKLVKLDEAGKKKFRAFSLGMKQRLGIAYALLDNPDLIILDEPINGLDPIGISEMRDIFRMLNIERGITIIISSHILTELYAVSNKFLFIENGNVLKEITKEELDMECKKCTVFAVNDTKKATILLEEKLNINNYKVIDDTEINIYDAECSSSKINRVFVENDIDVMKIGESGMLIENYFKSLVNENKIKGE